MIRIIGLVVGYLCYMYLRDLGGNQWINAAITMLTAGGAMLIYMAILTRKKS